LRGETAKESRTGQEKMRNVLCEICDNLSIGDIEGFDR
jgi:hypothetical protein